MSQTELETPPWDQKSCESTLDELEASVDAAIEEPTEEVASPTEIATDSLAFGMAFMLGLNVVQRIVGLSRNIMVCRMLDPEELGRWNLAFSFLCLAAPLAVFGLPGVFGRYVEYYRHRGALRSFLWRISVATIAVVSVALTAISLAPAAIAQAVFNDAQQVGLIRLSVTVLVLVIAFNFLIELMTALRRVRLVSIMQFCHSLVFAAVAVGLLYATSWGTSAVISAYAAGCLIAIALVVPALWSTWSGLSGETAASPAASMWRKLAPYALWIWATNILANLYNVADRYMLVHFASYDAHDAAGLVGQYHSALVVPQLMFAAAAMFSGVLLPYMANEWELGNRTAVYRQLTLALKLVALSFTVGGAVLLAAAPVLFDLLLGGKYEQGMGVLPITIVQCIWAGLLTVATNYLWCRERPGLASGALLAGLLLNLLFNVILVPLFGLSGAIVATAIANASALALTYTLNARLDMPISLALLLTSALPLLLLAGPVVAFAVITATLILAWKTDWLLTAAEKETIVSTLRRKTQPAAF